MMPRIAEAAASSSQPTLVVVVTNRRDWQRVTEERWYRIPLRRAPSPVAALFLAFYLTSRAGATPWQVAHYAPVRRYQLVRRCELLPDEPGHPRAQELYYRVDLGPIERLARPVPSRRLRRVTFIPTTLARLHEASDVAGLWLPDDGAALVWQQFSDAARKASRRLELEPGLVDEASRE